MTRVYQDDSLAAGPKCRVLVVGAGYYSGGIGDKAFLEDLTSVPASVSLFLQRLIMNWSNELSAPLFSIDLLLSNPNSPNGAKWEGFGSAHEIAPGSPVDPPTLGNFTNALQASTYDVGPQDVWILLLCGHGFWKNSRYFVLSDFGTAGPNPWAFSVLDIDNIKLGMMQLAPRQQWIFADCCSNIPQQALDQVAQIGTAVMPVSASRISDANREYGPLERVAFYSSTVGQVAYGVANQPSRFCEMLVEAIDGAGSVRKTGNTWWVDIAGIREAMASYAERKDPVSPEFYQFPIDQDIVSKRGLLLRKLPAPPPSMFIARSEPMRALKTATINIVSTGNFQFNRSAPPSGSAVLRVPVPAFQAYTVSVDFTDPHNCSREGSFFAFLPVADQLEFKLP